MTAPVEETAFDPGSAAARATDAILHDTLHGSARGVVVDSRPAPASPRWWCARRWSWPRRAAR